MPNPDPRRSGNPAKRAQAATGPRPRQSGGREAVGRRSRGLLVRLAKLPPLVIPLLMLVIMLVGLTGPLWLALIALALAAAFVGWLAFLSWPVLDTRGRLLRGLMLGLIIGAGIGRTSGWL
jgi:hypothetical protein